MKKNTGIRKKNEISWNNRATPPTLERAKRADQHVSASARNIKKINMMSLETPKIKILTVIRTTSHSHFVLAASRPSNSPFGLVFGLKRRPSVRPPASLWDVKTPQKNAAFPTFFLLEMSRSLEFFHFSPIDDFFRTRFWRLVKKYVDFRQFEFQKMGPNREIFTLLWTPFSLLFSLFSLFFRG